MKNKSKILLFIILFFGILLVCFFIFSSQREDGTMINNIVSDKLFGWKFPVVKFPLTGSSQVAYSGIRRSEDTPLGLPVRLKIPIISVDSAIEDAYITPDGRMDVPSGSINVAWFSLGPHPGQEGSAVIGGHFGMKNETPFVFYNLDKLRIGNKVYIYSGR